MDAELAWAFVSDLTSGVRNRIDDMNVLVIGGAGFIGTHLVRRLLREGYSIAVLDNFTPQVHGANQALALDLADHVELYRADVRNTSTLAKALSGRDAVVHLAAETGTGQSMYEVERYEQINIGGVAAIFDVLINNPGLCPRKLVLASSRAVYGEGKYRCSEHGNVYPNGRAPGALKASQYDPLCPECGVPCTPEATTEDSPHKPLSFYGLTKSVQEKIAFMLAATSGLSVCALRYQNVFGPGQSLRNPYTGILAIFSNLVRCGKLIQIFEDGQESRDFVFIEDIVEATWRCLKMDVGSSESFNVGTGQRTSVLSIAEQIVEYFGTDTEIRVTGAFREGDIRHNFADITKLTKATGFIPQVPWRNGLVRFLDWAAMQEPCSTPYEESLREMSERGLLRG
jgi:dTDP-L-rhamnose 4-epimerase